MNLTSRHLDFRVKDVREAEAYCRALASEHYENFTVVIPGLSADIRQDLANIYAFARWADDLADETQNPETALRRLEKFEMFLEETYKGNPPNHPVFLALKRSVDRRDYDQSHFFDLLSAFRQDQRVNRYQTFSELINYCERSANPVGRLVLQTFDMLDEQTRYYADKTCSALQLTNFWADVALDADKGRIYFPQEDLERFSVQESDIFAEEMTRELRDLIAFQVERTRDWFRVGWQLVEEVGGPLALCVEGFNAGGWAVLEKLEKENFDVFTKRWTLTGTEKAWLFVRGLWRWSAGVSRPPC